MPSPTSPPAPDAAAVPAGPTGHIDCYLSPEEIAVLRKGGRDPADYIALVQPVQDRGVGVGQTPMGKAVIMQIMVVIPYECLPLRLSGLHDASGQALAGKEILDQIPGAPMIRMLVKRAALGGPLRQFAEEAVKSAAAHSAGDVAGVLDAARSRASNGAGS